MGLIFALFDIVSSWDLPFSNQSSSNTCIMVLQKLNFFFSFVLHFFLHCHAEDDLWNVFYGFSASAMQAGALLTLFFAWNAPNIQRAGSKIKHSDTLCQNFYITRALALTIEHSVFSLMATLLFMLFSVCNAANKWIKNILANRFSTNNLLGVHQEIIISLWKLNKQF